MGAAAVAVAGGASEDGATAGPALDRVRGSAALRQGNQRGGARPCQLWESICGATKTMTAAATTEAACVGSTNTTAFGQTNCPAKPTAWHKGHLAGSAPPRRLPRSPRLSATALLAAALPESKPSEAMPPNSTPRWM